MRRTLFSRTCFWWSAALAVAFPLAACGGGETPSSAAATASSTGHGATSGTGGTTGATSASGGSTTTSALGSTTGSASGTSSGTSSGAIPRDGGTPAAIRLSGCYSAHTAPVEVGGQTFALNIDTGSASLGVAAATCGNCADAGVWPLYVPDAGATDLGMMVQSLYDVGELGWTGELTSDRVSIAGVQAQVAFGAIDSQTDYFYPGECDSPDGGVPAPYEGIIGFGPSGLLLPGTTSYLDQAVDAGAMADLFALSLCHVGGTLWLGGFDPSVFLGDAQYTPLAADSAYYVQWTETTVGDSDAGATTAMPPDALSSMIDSGGDEIVVPDAPFAAIAAALNASPAIQAKLGQNWFASSAQPFVSCITLDESPAALDAELPTLTLTLGSASPIRVTLTATESYLTYTYGEPSGVSYCQGLIDGEATYGSSFFYLGQSLMLNHVLVYDRANRRAGIAPAARCGF